jgi:hypothetical protein
MEHQGSTKPRARALIDEKSSRPACGCSGQACGAAPCTDRLVASPDLSRQDAEFVGVPITNDHLDRGQRLLIAALSPSLFGKQMIEQIDVQIRIVSHDPVPLTILNRLRPNRGG